MTKALLLLSLLTLLPGTSSAAQCAEQVSALAERLVPAPLWTELPDSQLHARVRRTRGAAIGSWVVENTYPDGHVELVLRTMDEVKLFTWERPDCRLQYASRKINSLVPSHPFTDSDLRELVAGKKAGLVYAWSPNMPLSEDSVRDIAEAAKSMGLELTYVADPNVDAAFVERVAKRDGLDIIEPKQMHSLELAMLGMHMHYPSTLVYSNGRILTAFPGAKSSGAYVTLIKEALEHAQN
jgi:hypothetical protein